MLILCTLEVEATAWSGRFSIRDPGDEVEVGPATLRIASGSTADIIVVDFEDGRGRFAGVGPAPG